MIRCGHAHVVFSLLSAAAFLLPVAVFTQDVTIGDARPTTLHVPPTYDPDVPMPLLLLLHGYTSDGAGMEGWTRFRPLADELGFLHAAPNGLGTTGVDRTWTNRGLTGTNSAYLLSLIQEVQTRFNVDADRIVVTGYSDGGFMCYQVGCDHGELITAIASGAGRNKTGCTPPFPVPMLEIHSVSDGSVSYSGGASSIRAWAVGNGCLSEPAAINQQLDLVSNVPDLDTTISRWTENCVSGAVAELWTIAAGTPHVPNWTSEGTTTRYARLVSEWLLSHPKRPAPESSFTLVPERGVAPLQITVDASASTAPEGTEISGYHWRIGGAEFTAVPLVTHTVSIPGRQPVSLQVVTGDQRVSLKATRLVDVLCPSGDVSPPWNTADVGGPVYPGATRWLSGDDDGCLAVCAGGLAGVSGDSEQFHFVHRPMSGDVILTARISEVVTNGQLVSAGLTLRESLEPDARYAAVLVEGLDSSRMRFRLRYRDEVGGRSRLKSGDLTEVPDAWVRIRCSGADLIGFSSPDGGEWTEISRVRINFSEGFFAGVMASGFDRYPDQPYMPMTATVCNLSVEVPQFLRGDCNGDSTVDTSDPVATLGYLFLGIEDLGCLDAADANDSSVVDISDAVYSLTFLFLGGPSPAAPFPTCGPDPTDDGLGCLSFEGCTEP